MAARLTALMLCRTECAPYIFYCSSRHSGSSKDRNNKDGPRALLDSIQRESEQGTKSKLPFYCTNSMLVGSQPCSPETHSGQVAHMATLCDNNLDGWPLQRQSSCKLTLPLSR